MLSFLIPIILCSPPQKQSSCSTTKKQSKPPYGYWKNPSNLSAELRAFADQTAENWRMPTQAELLSGGRSDIAGAVRRQGSWKSAADNAGLVLTSIARPRGLYLTFCTDIRRMRPYMYWRNFDNLRRELLEFISTQSNLDTSNPRTAFLPSAAQLEAARRSDLVRAIRMHGGFERVARLLDFRARYHSRKYWVQFENVERELLQVIDEFGEAGVMPPVALLKRCAPPGLMPAIENLHGGSTAVARRMGLQCLYPRRPSGYWKRRENRVRELKAFLEVFEERMPERDRTRMPSSLEMIRMGRSDLVRALCRYEGFSNMAVLVGLRPYGRAYREVGNGKARGRKGRRTGGEDGGEDGVD